MTQMTRPRTRTRRLDRRGQARAHRRAKQAADPALSQGAAAAERASAGIGTMDLEPTDWLFGDTLSGTASRPC